MCLVILKVSSSRGLRELACSIEIEIYSKRETHPCTLAGDELVIFGLDAGAAPGVIVFLLEVRVILQLFRCLEGKTGANSFITKILKLTQATRQI